MGAGLDLTFYLSPPLGKYANLLVGAAGWKESKGDQRWSTSCEQNEINCILFEGKVVRIQILVFVFNKVRL